MNAPATTARAIAVASGPVAARMLTTQMISPAVRAVRMLAFRAAAARLAVTANAAGPGWRPASAAIRMVMSCRLSGSFMLGTVCVVYDISGSITRRAEALLAAERCAQ